MREDHEHVSESRPVAQLYPRTHSKASKSLKGSRTVDAERAGGRERSGWLSKWTQSRFEKGVRLACPVTADGSTQHVLLRTIKGCTLTPIESYRCSSTCPWSSTMCTSRGVGKVLRLALVISGALRDLPAQSPIYSTIDENSSMSVGFLLSGTMKDIY